VTCSSCHVETRTSRNIRGQSLCRSCWYATVPRGSCAGCSNLRKLPYVMNGRGVCVQCRYPLYTTKSCERCGKPKKNVFRSTGLCGACSVYRQHRVCSVCGHSTYSWQRKHKPVCMICARRASRAKMKRPCGICNRVMSVPNVIRKNRVCKTCYRLHGPKKRCPVCNDRHVLVSRLEGTAVCEPCFRRTKPRRRCGVCRAQRRVLVGEMGRCRGCQEAALIERERHSICSSCGAMHKGCAPARRFDSHVGRAIGDAFSDPDGTIMPSYEPVVLHLRRGRIAPHWLAWLDKMNARTRRLVREVGSEPLSIDHLHVDGSRKPAQGLTRLLIESGAIESRAASLHILEIWLANRHLPRVHTEHAGILKDYLRDSVAERMQIQLQLYGYVSPQLTTYRTQIRVATDFLCHLESKRLTFAGAWKNHVDAFCFAHAKVTSNLLSPFLQWGSKLGYCRRTIVPVTYGSFGDLETLSEDELAEVLAPCFDPALCAKDRLISGLVAFYAQFLNAILRCRPCDVDDTGEELYLEVGPARLFMVEPYASALRELNKQSSGSWLFENPAYPLEHEKAPTVLRRLRSEGLLKHEIDRTRYSAFLHILRYETVPVAGLMLGRGPSAVARGRALARPSSASRYLSRVHAKSESAESAKSGISSGAYRPSR
jgi:hypothetical protein